MTNFLRIILCINFLLLLSQRPFLFSQDVNPPDQSLDNLSQSIKEELTSLKIQSETMKNDLMTLQTGLQDTENKLRLSEEERQALQTQLTDFHTSSMSMIRSLDEFSQKNIILQEKLKTKDKTIFWSLLIIGLFFVLKIGRIFLGIWHQTASIVNSFAATKIGKLIDIII